MQSPQISLQITIVLILLIEAVVEPFSSNVSKADTGCSEDIFAANVQIFTCFDICSICAIIVKLD